MYRALKVTAQLKLLASKGEPACEFRFLLVVVILRGAFLMKPGARVHVCVLQGDLGNDDSPSSVAAL